LGGAGTTPTIIRGKIGQGLQFDGVDDRLNAGIKSSLDNITNITISLWAKPSGAGNEFLAKVNSGGSAAIGPDLWYDSSGNVWFARRFDSSDGSWQTNDNPLTFNQWQHIVLRFEGVDTAIPEIIVNTVKGNVVESSTPSGALSDDSAQDLGIGVYGARTSSDAFFDGSLDEIRIYNRLLTDDEIKRLYVMGK
jgi:concanavalin A-like lectin/glucanase superfamily protein